MEKLLGVGMLGQVIACAVVGARLLLLARRTRQAPELCLGASFVLLGVLGYPLSVVARVGDVPSIGLLAAALAAQDAACLFMYAATWRTFRADSGTPGLAICAVAIGFATSVGLGFATGAPNDGSGYYLGFSLRAGAFAWPAIESFRHYQRLERRLRIGLGDPIVSDRFRLWAVSTGTIVLAFAAFLAGKLLSENPATNPWVLCSSSVGGIVAGTTMWLAFFPPARYLRRVGSQTPA